MILTFPEVVSESEHREILGLVAAAEFVDGRETARPLLARAKDNQQIRRDAAQVQSITEILLGALRRNAAFCGAVYPKQLHSLLVSRYREGMRSAESASDFNWLIAALKVAPSSSYWVARFATRPASNCAGVLPARARSEGFAFDSSSIA